MSGREITQVELDAILARAQPEPIERTQDRLEAQRQLHRLMDEGLIELGPKLKIALKERPTP